MIGCEVYPEENEGNDEKVFEYTFYNFHAGFMVTQKVKNLPEKWETQVHSLGWIHPLVLTTHSSIFAWRIPWTEEPGRQ